MIPAQIDVLQIVLDLKTWGWNDYKIEVACGLGQGYIAQVRAGGIKEPAYGKAARLYNFWFDQLPLQTRAAEATTT
jgi:hypothetical protein